MSSVNKVIIIGNLGKDPEIRTFNTGTRVASFSVATSESWKDKQTGEKKEKTEWHRVSLFAEHLVSVAERFLRKGSKVYLEGQLETRKWTDKEGVEKFSTDVVLRPYHGELVMLDAPRRSDAAPVDAQQAVGSVGSSAFDIDDAVPF